MYGSITSRTGWTPKEINELTLGQLHAYVRYWTNEGNAGYGHDENGAGLLFDDIGTFNETVGIKRVPKQV